MTRITTILSLAIVLGATAFSAAQANESVLPQGVKAVVAEQGKKPHGAGTTAPTAGKSVEAIKSGSTLPAGEAEKKDEKTTESSATKPVLVSPSSSSTAPTSSGTIAPVAPVKQ